MQSDNHVIVLSRVDFIKNNYLQADFLIKTQNLELEANPFQLYRSVQTGTKYL